MADATTRGIHDVVVQVRGRGDAYYASTLEPRAESLTGEFDPLAHLVRAGAAVGVRVHAWGNVFFVWSSPEGALPWAPEHLVRRHPEWLLRPAGVKYLDPVGGSDWEGIYIDPKSTAAREHSLAVFTDIVSRYPVEGFHYDYVRYPQVTYAGSPDDHAAVTALVAEGAKRLRAARPGLVISAAVFHGVPSRDSGGRASSEKSARGRAENADVGRSHGIRRRARASPRASAGRRRCRMRRRDPIRVRPDATRSAGYFRDGDRKSTR